jgi:hypothetical protein
MTLRPTILSCGPWRAELRGDELADLRYGDHRLLRAIRAVVRNHNWLTLTPEVTSTHVVEHPESLELRLAVRWGGLGAAYDGVLSVAFDAGRVRVEFVGTASEEFRSNRIGLIVLHHPDDSGSSAQVTSPDGTVVHASFPEQISPHQPFVDIATFSWERSGHRCRLEFEGDVFETEDQRNWTDASFKTYSTPLSKPFPVLHAPGDEVRQSVTLTVRPVVRVLDEVAGEVPVLGTSAGTSAGAGTAFGPPPESLGPPPESLGPLLVEVALEPDAAGAATISVAEAARLAETTGAPLDVRAVASTAEEARKIVAALPLDRVERLGVFDSTDHVTEPELWEALAAEAAAQGFAGTLVAGARAYFTELNRNRGSVPEDAGGLVYSITPQMHAVELEAIVETLPIQALTARDALRIGGGRPLHIGPITLTRRFNAVSTQAPSSLEAPAPDPLQGEPFAAAWLLGSVASLTLPGVASLCYGSLDDLETPAGRILTQLAALRGHEVLATVGRNATAVVYPVRTSGGILCWAANLAPWPTAVDIVGPDDHTANLSLDAWGTAAVVLP